MHKNNFNIEETIWAGWEVFKKQWKNLLWALFAYIVATIPLNIIDGFWNMRLYDTEMYLPEGATEEIGRQIWVAGTSESALHFIFAALMFAWTIVIGYNWYKSFYTVYDGEVYKFADMFKLPNKESVTNFLNYIGAYLCYGFMVLVGFLFLIIPGIYLAIRYGQALNLVVDKNMGISEAFAMSAKMTEGIKWKFIGFGLIQFCVAFAIILAGLICLLVGVIPAIFILFGWLMFTNVGLYRKLYEVNK